MKKLILFTISLLMISCKSYTDQSTKPEHISLISVISTPEKFHDKNIIIDGYFVLESEGDALYISKNDYDTRMHKNAIYLFIDPELVKNSKFEKPYVGYVRINGKFNKNIKGSYDFYSGTITVNTIERIQKFDSKGNSTNVME